jgi:hypothetical protein
MLSRRDFLKIAGVSAGGVLLHGCAPKWLPFQPAPSATSLPSATATRTSIATATGTATTTSTATPSSTPTLTETPTAIPTEAPTDTETPTELPTEEIGIVPAGTASRAGGSAGTSAGGKLLCFVLWDHQLAQYDYKPRNIKKPVPETCPLRSGATIRLTAAWEAYWRGILHVCNPTVGDKDFERSWKSLVMSARAFTNHSGPDSGNFGLHSLTCGGATHQMVTGKSDGRYMEIYTLNGSQDPPPLPTKISDIDMTRHFFATTGSNVKLDDGTYAVYGFPQFENCIVPLVSPKDTDLIEVSRIKKVYEIQRPYNP